jgi:hypothetical protein
MDANVEAMARDLQEIAGWFLIIGGKKEGIC